MQNTWEGIGNVKFNKRKWDLIFTLRMIIIIRFYIIDINSEVVHTPTVMNFYPLPVGNNVDLVAIDVLFHYNLYVVTMDV